jgi:hypothetical protein
MTHQAELVDDPPAGSSIQTFRGTFFAPQFDPFGLLRFSQLAFDDHLRGDACMVRSGLPTNQTLALARRIRRCSRFETRYL